MSRWKVLLGSIMGLVLVSAMGFAQNSMSILVVERGYLVEKQLDGDVADGHVLPIGSDVMYVHGRSPSTGDILVATWDEEAARMDLVMADLVGNNAKTVATNVVWSAWSPDGDRFCYYTNTGALYLSEKDSIRLLTTGVAAASFSPDGQSLALIRTPELQSYDDNPRSVGLSVLNVATGEEQHLTSKYNEGWSLLGYAPYWTPNGRELVFISNDGPSPFWRIPVDGGAAQPMAADDVPAPTTQLFWSQDGTQVFFGTERLDADSLVWRFDLGKLAAGAGDYLEVIAENGEPLGFVDGRPDELVIARPNAVLRYNVDTQAMASLDDPSNLEELLAAEPTGSTYHVLFYSPLPNGVWRISSWFSHNQNRTDGGPFRYDCVNFGRRGHYGTDMATGLGTAIFAGRAGVVEFINNNCGSRTTCVTASTTCGGGFGNYPRVRHRDGNRTIYAHESNIAARVGQNVTEATRLGSVGSTGNSTGCHLHFQINLPSGRPVDPYFGRCNWLGGSFWKNPNNPRRP